MITIGLLLLIAAFICAVAAVFKVAGDRVDLTAIAVLLVIVMLALGSAGTHVG